MTHSVPMAEASMCSLEAQTGNSLRAARTWRRMRRRGYGLVWLGLVPLALGASVVNIDFNGDRYVPGPNARPGTETLAALPSSAAVPSLALPGNPMMVRLLRVLRALAW